VVFFHLSQLQHLLLRLYQQLEPNHLDLKCLLFRRAGFLQLQLSACQALSLDDWQTRDGTDELFLVRQQEKRLVLFSVF